MNHGETYFLTLINTGDEFLEWGYRKRYLLEWHLTPYDSDFKALQKQVGGCFEHWDIFPVNSPYWSLIHGTMHIDSWINDEGKLIGLPPTVPLIDQNGEVYDVVVGNICFLRSDDQGESYGLTLDECREVIKTFDGFFGFEYDLNPRYSTDQDEQLLSLAPQYGAGDKGE